ncbi:NAD(P)H-dependent oxidoreductase subunit E [Aeromicrobium sp. CF4.19]|uniref:(2Fe-2S) ferredoxin domain-containing protein n=1 Tax=Aeromicrobium sp. CF4.19 TaxID=3373082 RepID=UPI003EE6F69A
MPDAVVMVAMGVDAERHVDDLLDLAWATGATLAHLQGRDPSVAAELDRLRATGATSVTLVPASLGHRAPTRTWLRRIAADWSRRHPDVRVDVAGREVTGREAPLTSAAWEHVPDHARQVLVCRGPRCSARGAGETAAALDDALTVRGLGDDDVLVTQTGCLFPCNHAPVVVVHPEDTWYGRVGVPEASRIVDEHLVGGEPVTGLERPRVRGAARR